MGKGERKRRCPEEHARNGESGLGRERGRPQRRARPALFSARVSQRPAAQYFAWRSGYRDLRVYKAKFTARSRRNGAGQHWLVYARTADA